jgi:hypothetical protein
MDISASLIAKVAAQIVLEGLGTLPEDFSGDWETYARSKFWCPAMLA